MKCFHQVVNSNRRNNSIELVNGSVSSYQSEIGEHIVRLYDRLFSK
jgi:hypothetical protein